MKDFGPTNKKSRLLPPFATIVCFFLAFLVWTETIQAGGIEFLYYHPAGSTDDLHGRVWDVTVSNYKVAVYIKVAGGWWTKPTWAEPNTPIGSDKLWTCDITTAPTDSQATEFAAFLIPNGYTPPRGEGQSSLPGELYSYPYAQTTNLQSESSWIEYSYVPPYGSNADLEGVVWGVNPADYNVATYIQVGSWWTKPTGIVYISIRRDLARSDWKHDKLCRLQLVGQGIRLEGRAGTELLQWRFQRCVC